MLIAFGDTLLYAQGWQTVMQLHCFLLLQVMLVTQRFRYLLKSEETFTDNGSLESIDSLAMLGLISRGSQHLTSQAYLMTIKYMSIKAESFILRRVFLNS